MSDAMFLFHKSQQINDEIIYFEFYDLVFEFQIIELF